MARRSYGPPSSGGRLPAGRDHAATHDVYLGLVLAAVGTLVGVLVIVPRRFATTAGATASVGPGGAGQAEQAGEAPASAPVPPGRRN
ncbi:MAG TPA: hypothetical protein VF256_03640 [Streptosporangiaceae bacterium]